MTSSCPKRRRAKRTCALMADRTPCLRREGMINATSPNQEGVEGTDSRSGLDDHRRISDTGHIYLLVGNTVVLPYQGGIFLRSFATAYISLRNSWALQPHHKRYWLTPPPADPAALAEQICTVCQVYEATPIL